MFLAASALAAAIPLLVYLILIRHFNPDLTGRLIKYFLWGGVGSIIFTMIVSGSFLEISSIFIADKEKLGYLETYLIAPFVEEIIKGIFLFFMIMNKKFDPDKIGVKNGFIYGGAIGLGFGMTENFLYFITYSNTFDQWLTIVIVRTFFSAAMHFLAAAAFGAFLGYAKSCGCRMIYKIIFPIIGLSIAIFLHFAWNFTVSFEAVF